MGGKDKAVVLLSGGLDSSVAAYKAVSDGYEIYALTVEYGQRHDREILSAEQIAKSLGAAEHKVLRLDLSLFGGSALTDDAIDVPEDGGDTIPVTYVPARNTILLSLALAYAEVVDAAAIYSGVNSIDYSGYPDCRPEYFKAFQDMADIATRKTVEGGKITLKTPLMSLSKKEIVELGQELAVPFADTWSCYRGGLKACGACDSCRHRLKGFREAGLTDPIEYEL
ncbi:7-cyano-7-deazaguanine synthase QueC [Candidatus Altiarchaeota archaeon]